MVAGDEVETLIHIHNGDLVAELARHSDVGGRHVPFRESLVTGRVVPGNDWIESRAHVLHDGNGRDLLRIRTDLLEQEQLLDAARSEDEIVLWFEHDLYCLIHFVYLLHRLGGARLSVVWSPEQLGMQDERALHLLFDSRQAVTPAMIRLAKDVWRAYTSADPTQLNRWLETDQPEFPFLREGLALHAARFPSTRNGLGSIEQQTLERMASGMTDFASLFEAISGGDPRLGLTDSELYRLLCGVAWTGVPLATIAGEFPKVICTLTPAGEKVLTGEADALALNEPDFWLGGAHVTRENAWRWDGKKIVSSRSAAS